jgi:hypothetical protein
MSNSHTDLDQSFLQQFAKIREAFRMIPREKLQYENVRQFTAESEKICYEFMRLSLEASFQQHNTTETRIEKEGEIFIKCGTRAKFFLTLFGEIRLHRSVYHSENKTEAIPVVIEKTVATPIQAVDNEPSITSSKKASTKASSKKNHQKIARRLS